jgi:exopolysaccharide production protein ExoZ
MPATGAGQVFLNVQILRGIAAIMVVLYHVGGGLRDFAGFTSIPGFYFGNSGVDLFFLISGFVIYRTTRGLVGNPNGWSVFLERRLTRIVPLYWIITSAKLASLLVLPGMLEHPELDPWQVAGSYLFIPAWDSTRSTVAIVASGWTLCFEMFFYVVCAYCLSLQWSLLRVTTPLFLALAAVGAFRTERWGSVATLLDPLLIEFVAGMWVGYLSTTHLQRLGPSAAGSLMAAGFAGLLATSAIEPAQAFALRVLVWGVPSAAILAGAIALEGRIGASTWRLPLVLGNASYAIYLAEPIVRPLVSITKRLRFGWAGEHAVFALLVVVAVFVGVAIYYTLEQPMLRVIRSIANLVRPEVRLSRST